MFADARSLANGAAIKTDLCIIGAGPAGITLAREFIGSSLHVCMLESGGFDVDNDIQALAQAENRGDAYYSLDKNRQRIFGGTSHLWAGWCRPLDPLDFVHRPWVPASGWPISESDIEPYYRRTHEICQLGQYEYDVDHWQKQLQIPQLPLPPGEVVSKIYHLSPPTRFGQIYRATLAQAQNVAVFLHANVLEIEATTSGKEVNCLRVGCLAGNRFSVQARYYVLACGGAENARLLLLSNKVHAAGLGNDHDLVGRYLMEHVHFAAGLFLPSEAANISRHLPLYEKNWRSVVARLFLTEEVQRQEELLNYSAMLESCYVVDETGAAPKPRLALRLHHTLEQAPNPASRITLSQTRDALNLPKAEVHWHTTPLDRQSYLRSFTRLAAAWSGAGLGTLYHPPDDNLTTWPPEPLQGERGHHMGTSRMSVDPRSGVVDPHGRVHGLNNLFVAGSSVFSTSGSGTPTFTIVALALRLAEHLKELHRVSNNPCNLLSTRIKSS